MDTNVVTYFVVGGTDTAKAEEVRRKDGAWHVPSLFPHEWLNVVTRYLRQGVMTRDDALRAYRRGLSIVTIDESPPDALRVLNLHLASGCTSYDCEFVDAAEARGMQLVTEDKQVLATFPGIAVDLASF